MFGLGMGNFWNPESGFPVLAEEKRLFEGPGPRDGAPRYAQAQGRLWPWSRGKRLHLGESALFCLRVRSATQTGPGGSPLILKGAPDTKSQM